METPLAALNFHCSKTTALKTMEGGRPCSRAAVPTLLYNYHQLIGSHPHYGTIFCNFAAMWSGMVLPVTRSNTLYPQVNKKKLLVSPNVVLNVHSQCLPSSCRFHVPASSSNLRDPPSFIMVLQHHAAHIL